MLINIGFMQAPGCPFGYLVSLSITLNKTILTDGRAGVLCFSRFLGGGRGSALAP